MTDDELDGIVAHLRALGADTADVEAKRAEGGLPKSVRDSLSAFANARGGVLILGLDESSGFTATGLRDPAKLASDLASLCSADMEPPLRPLIAVHHVDGNPVLVAEIPVLSPAARPCFYRGAGIIKGSFVRVSDQDRQLSPYEVQLMLASRGQPRDDEEPVADASLDDLEPVAVDELVARLRDRRPFAFAALDRLAVLRRARVVVPDGTGGHAPSLAALLALGRYPQEHFAQLMVSFVHYPTATGADLATGARFLDNTTLEGPIPVMVRDALAAVRRNEARAAYVSGVGRTDVPDYPDTAIREAVVNALVHRDYSPTARGTQVQIEMYPDRLTIRSPGGLFGQVSIDRLGQDGISSSRNAVLMRLLEDVPVPGETRAVCENRGSGIRTMTDALRAADLHDPRFDDRIASFTVTFDSKTLLPTAAASTVPGTAESADSGRADRRDQILRALGDGTLSRAEIAIATGLNDRTVRRWLTIMRGEGSVASTAQTAQSPDTQYRRAEPQ